MPKNASYIANESFAFALCVIYCYHSSSFLLYYYYIGKVDAAHNILGGNSLPLFLTNCSLSLLLSVTLLIFLLFYNAYFELLILFQDI